MIKTASKSVALPVTKRLSTGVRAQIELDLAEIKASLVNTTPTEIPAEHSPFTAALDFLKCNAKHSRIA